MLVLSRRENESIVVDHTITIKVVGIRGNKVRLAIDAPPEILVDREEVRRRREREMPAPPAPALALPSEEPIAPLSP